MSAGSPATPARSTTSVLQPSPEIDVTTKRRERCSVDSEGPESVTDTPKTLRRTKQRSFDDIRLLAISAQITEVLYSIGELQTRIFEIQELRHRAVEPTRDISSGERKSSDSTGSSSSVIDNALGQLDVRMEAVTTSITSITDSLEPMFSSTQTPTQELRHDAEQVTMLARKYGDLMVEWEAVLADGKALREELKEDKWLAVFRTVSEQADGMMSSLDKAVNMCQDFINQVYNGSKRSSGYSDTSFPTLSAFNEIHKSYEAKKKYYMPSTSKVINVLNKGVEDRITKNGECLRKYADMKTRWDALRVKIKRVDHEMEKIERLMVDLETEANEAENNSVISESSNGLSHSGRLSRAPSNASSSTLSRFAAKVSLAMGRSTPNQKSTSSARLEPPSQTPTMSRRSSFMPNFRTPQPGQDTVKVRPKLFSSASKVESYSSSMNDDWVDLGNGRGTIKPQKPKWNSSTKTDILDGPPPPLPPVSSSYRPPSTLLNRPPSSMFNRTTPPRPPSSSGRYGPGTKPPTTQPPPIPTRSPARPYTPVRIQSNGSGFDRTPPSRPASRTQSVLGMSATPRARPKTPSHIPAPRFKADDGFLSSNVSVESDDPFDTSPFAFRAITPLSAPAFSTPSRHRPTTSGSHIPIPTFQVSASRPTTPSMGHLRPFTPNSSAAMSSSSLAQPRSHTPDGLSLTRTPRTPLSGSTAGQATPGKPALRTSSSKGPPSSFRDSTGSLPPFLPSTGRSPSSRPSSRSGSYPVSSEPTQGPMYFPASERDPLDMEIARVANSVPHGMLLERLDPVLRSPPRPGEEVKAQYAISNSLGRRTMIFRLQIIHKATGETRRVMCRVGGGWVDLTTYLTNRYSI